MVDILRTFRYHMPTMTRSTYLTIGFYLTVVLLLSLGVIPPALFMGFITVFMVLLLVRESFSPEATLVGTLVVTALGSAIAPEEFITTKDVFAGFSNPAVITVGALFVVARGVSLAGIFDGVAAKALGEHASAPRAVGRLALPVMALSSVLNNTPIVSIFMPVVRKWAIGKQISPSKLLMPLSYLTIFGGTCTLLGTSTNLVVKGLADQAGIESFKVFDLAWVGLPLGIAGVFYLIFLGHRLLPQRTDLLEATSAGNAQSYVVEARIEIGSPLAEKSIAESGLRDIEDLFLFEVRRYPSDLLTEGYREEIFAPVRAGFELHEGDRLIFSGSTEKVEQLASVEGLSLLSHDEASPIFDVGENAQMIEVIIAPTSSLKGKTINEIYFNRTYDAAVIAFQRGGESLKGGFADIPLQVGDTLLLVAGIGFRRIWQNRNEFIFASPLRDDLNRGGYGPVVLTLIIGMILLPALGLLDILYTSLIVSMVMIWTRLLDAKQVMRCIDWSVLLVIAASFGVSAALLSSGAARYLSEALLASAPTLGPIGVLVLLYLLTNVLTEIITNNAAAALAFPVALGCASSLGVSATPFVVTVAVAASASFATPMGYQTNMLVYGPGGYRYTDYTRVGLALNLLYLVGTALIVPAIWPFGGPRL